MSTKQKRKSAAIKFVNQVRKALGKSPITYLPVGLPNDPNKCPLGLAIEDEQAKVFKETLEFPDNPVKSFVVGAALGYDVDWNLANNALVLDKDVFKFVEDFDELKYPELVDIKLLLAKYNEYNG